MFWRAATLDSLGAWGIYGALVATIVVTLVLYETIHAIAARVLGCETQMGRQGLGVHVRLHGGFLSRRADAVIPLAPAVVLTAVGLPILVLGESPFGAAIIVTALVTNAAGIGSDLVARTDGYVGADIEAVCREASTAAVREYVRQSQDESAPTNVADIDLTPAHFERAFDEVAPQTAHLDGEIEEGGGESAADEFNEQRGW